VAAVAVLAALAVLGMPGAGADPLADADATVASLRAEADRAAQAYFDALAAAQALDAQIARLEAELPKLRAQQRALREEALARAANVYQRAGGAQLASILESDSMLDAARRVNWLSQLNARDEAAFRDLAKVSRQLETQRDTLNAAQVQQRAAIADLEAKGRDIDAKLQAAEDRKRALEAVPPRPVTPAAGADGAPPAAPPDYTPTPGAHPQHDHPFLVCTRNHEAGGRYNAYNPAGPYMGAYQFLQSTWNSTANGAGRPELIGVPPHTASEYDQDDMAWALYQRAGNRPWGGRC
jgi:hypothetical protein